MTGVRVRRSDSPDNELKGKREIIRSPVRHQSEGRDGVNLGRGAIKTTESCELMCPGEKSRTEVAANWTLEI